MSSIRRVLAGTPILGSGAKRLRDWAVRQPVVARRRMKDVDALHAFWSGPTPEGNDPHAYLTYSERSRALLALIAHLPKDARILEVGCNVGRNLAHLSNAGYQNVEGVEISEHAVALLRQSYPELATRPVHIGAAEQVLSTLEDASFDLLFTMAVIVHIHPNSATVFDHMARLSRRHILAIEPSTGHSSWRHFPHNIERLFTSRGFHLTSERRFWDIPEAERSPGMGEYSAYWFDRA